MHTSVAADLFRRHITDGSPRCRVPTVNVSSFCSYVQKESDTCTRQSFIQLRRILNTDSEFAHHVRPR